MDTPKLPAFSVQDADGKTITEEQHAHWSDTGYPQRSPSATLPANNAYDELNSVPVTSSFLEWRVLDDFGNEDESSSDVKIKRFLSAICHTLSAKCAPPNAVPAPQILQTRQPVQKLHGHVAQPGQVSETESNAQVGQSIQGIPTNLNGQPGTTGVIPHPAQIPSTISTAQAGQYSRAPQTLLAQASGSGRPNILVVGRTSKEVDDLTYLFMSQQQSVSNVTIIEQQFRKETAKLFSYYVPKTYDETLPPVRLFWGLLYELIVS